MIYKEGEISVEYLGSLRKQGFGIDIYKCEKKQRCAYFMNREGRQRCPGKLRENPNIPVGYKGIPTFHKDFCGWESDINNIQVNAIKVYTREFEKYLPPDQIIPII